MNFRYLSIAVAIFLMLSACKSKNDFPDVSGIVVDLKVERFEADFYKIDTEAEQELAAVFNIRSIPSILFIPKNGKPQMAMGALPKDALHNAIEEVLVNPEMQTTEVAK